MTWIIREHAKTKDSKGSGQLPGDGECGLHRLFDILVESDETGMPRWQMYNCQIIIDILRLQAGPCDLMQGFMATCLRQEDFLAQEICL